METGTVKWFNEQKGYGFIVPDSAGPDMFVHASSCPGLMLREGDKLRYEVGVDRDGRLRAVDVERV